MMSLADETRRFAGVGSEDKKVGASYPDPIWSSLTSSTLDAKSIHHGISCSGVQPSSMPSPLLFFIAFYINFKPK
jgi:hypothetical protein